MSVAIATLSPQGQIAIPMEILRELRWQAGTELKMIAGPSGVMIQAKPQATGRSLADLIGMLQHDGPPLATEVLCQPVDYGADGESTDGRNT